MKNLNTTSKKFAWISLGLCGLCCALPFIGVIVGIGSFTFLGFYLEKLAIVALSIAGAMFFFHYFQKRKTEKSCADSCEVDCGCKTGQQV